MVGTTMGFLAEIVEAVVPQISLLNPAEMATVEYGCLLHLPLRGFYFSPLKRKAHGLLSG
jgi:hypothetical protein